MNSWRRHHGDVEDYVDVRIDGVDSLASVTAVSASVSYGGGTPEPLTASVLDADARIVRVSLAPWLANAALGCWRLYEHLTFTGPIGPLTWPEGAGDELEILAAG